jgi:hypothetical protein
MLTVINKIRELAYETENGLRSSRESLINNENENRNKDDITIHLAEFEKRASFSSSDAPGPAD